MIYLKVGFVLYLSSVIYTAIRLSPSYAKCLVRYDDLPVSMKFGHFVELAKWSFTFGPWMFFADIFLGLFPHLRSEPELTIFENDCVVCSRPFETLEESETVCAGCRYRVQEALRADELKNGEL